MLVEAFMLLQSLDPFNTPIAPCSRVITSNMNGGNFVVTTTTPITEFRIKKASAPTTYKVEGNKVFILMKLDNPRSFNLEMEVSEQCGETWTPKMRTLL